MENNKTSESSGPTKTRWPEVVGLSAEEAKKKVKQDMPNAKVEVVAPGCLTTRDLNPQRVRLYVDEDDKVVEAPGLG